MRYMVTGGAGFIGSHLVDRLLELNHHVAAIDDFSLGKEENLKQHENNPNFSLCRRSICGELSDIFEKEHPDVVFHLAARPRVQFSIQNPVLTHDINVNGTHNLLDACRKAGVRRFVFSSSSSVYGNQETLPLREDMAPNPLSPYALHKLIGEQYCRMFNFLYGLETLSLRYFNVYGPRQDSSGDYSCLIPKFMGFVSAGKSPTIFGDGTNTRDFTYVADVVAANIAAADMANARCKGEVFNIGAGMNRSVNEVTESILKLAKSTITPIHTSPVIEARDSLAAISKAESFLGWQPGVSFEEGLKLTYNYFATSAKAI